MKSSIRAISLLSTGLTALACLTAPSGCYAETVTATLPAGSTPYAVAVNPVTNKAYVANLNSGNLTVIDGATNTASTIQVGSGPWWVAVNPVTNRIYTGNQYSGNVTVIDGATNNIVATVPAGTGIISVAVNPVTNRIYVSNEFSSSVTVIDGVTNTPIATVPAIGPEELVVNPMTNKIYVANEDGNSVTVIDGATNNTTIVVVGTKPTRLAVNPATNKIYVSSEASGTVTVIDGATNNTTTVATGTWPDAIALNPVTNKIYVANSHSGNVTVIDGATNTTTTVLAGSEPYSVAVNATTNRIYVTNQYGSSVTVIDGATNATTTLAVGSGPNELAVNPVTNKIYVANGSSGNVTVIDGAVNTTATVPAGTGLIAVAVNPVTNKIYTSNEYSSSVTVIDGATNNTATVSTVVPEQLAVNPVTNKIYVTNEGGNTVTVIDGATNGTTVVAAGINPFRLAVNPVTNKIYVANKFGSDVTVIDGATNSTATVATGAYPYAVAVNPVTNQIYVPNFHSGTVTVIDGATNNTTTVAAGSQPYAVAVNPVTNKIYVTNQFGDSVTVIDGASNNTTTVPVGSGPDDIAVNPVTNKIYVANGSSNNVTVIDGATNKTTTLAAGSDPFSVAVNQVTNKIYVANLNSGNVTVIDGATNTTSTVTAGSGPWWVAVNPVTNKAYVANQYSGNVTVISEEQVQPISLTTSINPLPGNQSSSSTPAFNFSAASTFAPSVTTPDAVFYQVDTWQGPWSLATGSNPTYAGTLAPVQPGFHILYAYAGDTQEASSTQPHSPLTGAIAAYGFLYGALVGPVLPAPTVTFTGAPANAAYNSMFTVAATTNASTAALITASGACSIAGNTVTMTSGTGTCSLTANWAADTNYSSATASQLTAAEKIIPTVTFTGAPASAAYHSMFTVSATTNASVAAVITSSGQCSNSGNTVTMTSGTGTCSLTANWSADSNYNPATANQSTTAIQAIPTVTFTGAPASAAYNSSFTVATTTNASTSASIASSGDCSNSGNMVTMGGSPGTCTLTASWAADSNFTSTTAGQSTTATNITIAPPRISNVAVSGITTTSAIISWTTDQGSNSQVEFGTTTGYGSVSPLDSTIVMSHSVTLTALASGTTYDYAVISVGAGGPAASANFIFSTPPTQSATTITPVGGAYNNTGSNNFPTSLVIPYTSSAGNTIVAVCALGSASSSISSISDSGSAWTLRAFANNGTAVRSEIWSTGAGLSGASTSFTINISGATPASCALEEYAGVLSIGTTATSQAISGTMSVSLTTHDPNDFIVAGLGANSYYGYLMTNGTMRQKSGVTGNSGNNYVEMVLCDNTAATATSVSCSSVSGSAPWAVPALELRAGSGGGVPLPTISSVASSNVTSTSAVITWTTDQASNSQVKYGTTAGYGSLSTLNTSLVTSHSVTLTGLAPGTTYNYAVVSADSGGTSSSGNFVLSTPVTIPVISAVASSGLTTSSATITWTTDQPSSSQVEFGTTTGYGSLSPLNSALVTAHSVNLTTLTPGTTYNYAVISTNTAGPATSTNFSFSTPSSSVVPVISRVGGAANNTGSSTTATSLSIPYHSSSGNTIVAVCALGNTTSSIASITDSGSTWTLQAGVNNGTAVRSEIWSTTAAGSVASTSFNINLSGGTPASCALEEYAGVVSLGSAATNAATSGTMSVTIAAPEANDYLVAGMGANSYYGYNSTNGAVRQAGGLTQNPGKNYVEMDLFDNTAATATSVTCSSVSGSAAWAVPALVLR